MLYLGCQPSGEPEKTAAQTSLLATTAPQATISGPTSIAQNQTYTYTLVAPSHFTNYLIVWSSDNDYIRNQVIAQSNNLSVGVTSSLNDFKLLVTIIDGSSPPQAATAEITVRVCPSPPCP